MDRTGIAVGCLGVAIGEPRGFLGVSLDFLRVALGYPQVWLVVFQG